jgi:hypothetical protein
MVNIPLTDAEVLSRTRCKSDWTRDRPRVLLRARRTSKAARRKFTTCRILDQPQPIEMSYSAFTAVLRKVPTSYDTNLIMVGLNGFVL